MKTQYDDQNESFHLNLLENDQMSYANITFTYVSKINPIGTCDSVK